MEARYAAGTRSYPRKNKVELCCACPDGPRHAFLVRKPSYVNGMTDQGSLFAANNTPTGLRYAPGFISPAEETELLTLIRRIDLQPFQFGAFEGKRRVAWYGWQYDYSIRKLTEAGDIPPWLRPFIERIEAFDRLAPGSIKQVLMTEYEAGAGIGWHRDMPHFDRIYGLSLRTPCKFRFRRKRGSQWQRFTLEAQPRSLYRMDDEARGDAAMTALPPHAPLQISKAF